MDALSPGIARNAEAPSDHGVLPGNFGKSGVSPLHWSFDRKVLGGFNVLHPLVNKQFAIEVDLPIKHCDFP